ncbi:MAG TPA: hypothetical protein VG713_12045, partial [Pirellulales bacterium]|nr:hypothetical protein [Pirellulales bacterium]
MEGRVGLRVFTPSLRLSVPLSAAALLLAAALAIACPFCKVQEPTFAERREAATFVGLAEVVGHQGEQTTCRVHQALKGTRASADDLELRLAELAALRPGALAVLLEGPAWSAIPVTEISAAYFARAPGLRLPASARLPYFARYLEHAEPAVAADAYAEFARAAVDEVAQVAGQVPMPALRRWLVDPDVPGPRKGLYGLLAGLAPAADDRTANAEVLHTVITTPASDFRAGFDGVLAGYLLLAGERGLDELTARLIADPEASPADVRHLLAALRFYVEFGTAIPTTRIAAAVRPLLARPEIA